MEYTNKKIFIDSKQEYAKLAQELARKNGTIPRSVEYAYTNKFFYVVKDNRFGKFTPLLQIIIVGNEDLISLLGEKIDNGSYKTTTTIAQWIGLIQGGKGGNDRNYDIASKTRTNERANVGNGGKPTNDARRNSAENSGNSYWNGKPRGYNFEESDGSGASGRIKGKKQFSVADTYSSKKVYTRNEMKAVVDNITAFGVFGDELAKIAKGKTVDKIYELMNSAPIGK